MNHELKYVRHSAILGRREKRLCRRRLVDSFNWRRLCMLDAAYPLDAPATTSKGLTNGSD